MLTFSWSVELRMNYIPLLCYKRMSTAFCISSFMSECKAPHMLGVSVTILTLILHIGFTMI